MNKIIEIEKESLSDNDISGKEIECECGCGARLRIFQKRETFEFVIHTVFVREEDKWKHTVLVSKENMEKLLR